MGGSYSLRVRRSPHFKPGLLPRTAAQTQQVHSGPERFRHHDCHMRVNKAKQLTRQTSGSRAAGREIHGQVSLQMAGLMKMLLQASLEIIQPYSNLA